MKNIFIPIKIAGFHNSEYVKRPQMKPHSHKKFEMIYIADGSALVTYSANEQTPPSEYECSAGQFALFKPGTYHAINQVGGYMRMLCLQLDAEDEYADLYEYLSQSRYISNFPTALKLLSKWEDTLIFTDNQNVAHVLEKFKKYFSDDPDIFTCADIEIDLKRLFMEVIRCSCESGTVRGQSVYIRKAMKYLEMHYNTDIDFGALSESLGISLSYLQKLFKRHLDDTLTGKLSEIRIRKAKQLLSETNMPISEIAARSGYNSIQALGAAFRKCVGMSPTEYRMTEPRKSVEYYNW